MATDNRDTITDVVGPRQPSAAACPEHVVTIGLPVTIRTTPDHPRTHSVQVDGTDIAAAISSMVVSFEGGSIPSATIELTLLSGIDIDQPALEVQVDDTSRALLTRLGWTPPAERRDRFEPAHTNPAIHTRSGQQP